MSQTGIGLSEDPVGALRCGILVAREDAVGSWPVRTSVVDGRTTVPGGMDRRMAGAATHQTSTAPPSEEQDLSPLPARGAKEIRTDARLRLKHTELRVYVSQVSASHQFRAAAVFLLHFFRSHADYLGQDLGRHDDDTVIIGEDKVTWRDQDSATIDWDVVVDHRAAALGVNRLDPSRKDREPQFLDFPDVAHQPIYHRSAGSTDSRCGGK